jgi:hypothetical protein
MHVEQVFGQLHIHSFCIDRKEPSVPTERAEETRSSSDFLEWWAESSVNSNQQGTRIDLEVSKTTMRLTDLLMARGITKPNL